MNRTIKNFIKDKLFTITFYWWNSILIVLFFYLLNIEEIEVLYPLAISLFLFLILIVVEWIRYYRFNYAIQQNISSYNEESLRARTIEQKNALKYINHVKNKHAKEVDSIKSLQEDKIAFLSQWIHSLKTPISVIDLLIQKYTKQDTIPYDVMASIKEENDRLNNSLQQVLNFIRLGTFEKDYLPETINLEVAIKRIINDNKREFIYNKVFPILNFKGDGIHVLSDDKWNSIMLQQIISNGIKYSNDGRNDKKLTFTITNEKEHTYLSIKDEGVGIPNYDIKRVFEAFFTGENGRKFGNSTGIGLYICKMISDRLGHKIEIKSQPSQGTEVIIRYLTKL